MNSNNYRKKLKREERANKLKESLHGEGLFLFQNNSSGDLFLPKPAKNGVRLILKGKQFEGDSYFMSLVRSHELKLIKIIEDPNKNQEETLNKHEEIKEVKMLNENKLILDQPEQFTEDGQVEHVVSNKTKAIKKTGKINETKTNKNKNVLINENPTDNSGIELLLN